MKEEPEEPIVSCIQQMGVYETVSRFYIVGSNLNQTLFRVLKIDRTKTKELIVIDDKVVYNLTEIKDILTKIDAGNPVKSSSSHSQAHSVKKPIASAHGIVGFIRLTEGYYVILITKRRKVAQIGHHTIYKIDDTAMIYIPNNGGEKKISSEERKYKKMFENIDLSSNFYFSYSYDLTRTLQYNMSPPQDVVVEEADDFIWDTKLRFKSDEEKKEQVVRRFKPLTRFVWNSYLLQGQDLHPEWTLNLIHGFVSQANIAVYGRPIFLTLIARRSSKFAGTRFLKRGANFDGDVANEVETEQIVFDSTVSSFKSGRFTSFVQLRGSVPSHWSQDVSKMVPKPLITIDVHDPVFRTPGVHFNDLLQRYGSPIFVLNLVKSGEKRPHEQVLSNEFIELIKYLNQFIPKSHAMKHIPFDMACFNALKEANVMIKLSDIAYNCLNRTGMFISWPSHSSMRGGFKTAVGRTYQTGTVRVNCVDCLDRTNTAQFALGRAALGLQLQTLGVLSEPYLEFDTDTVRMLEELYEDHGDTLALQYGGSQLVHRIKTYRKIAPLSSHSRDIMQTLSRYYSNTFSDSDKQSAINVFLGVFRPFQRSVTEPHVWELSTDYYFHNNITPENIFKPRDRPLTRWWSDQVAFSLPLPANQIFKSTANATWSMKFNSPDENENVDGYFEQYKPSELTVLDTTLYSHMLHTGKDFMPYFTTDFSPFRVRPIKRRSIVQSSGISLKSFFGSSSVAAPPDSPSAASSTSNHFFGNPKNSYVASNNPQQIFSSNPSISLASFQSSPSGSQSDEDEAPHETENEDDISFLGDTESVLSATENYNSPSCSRTFEQVMGKSNSYGPLFKAVPIKDKIMYDNYCKVGQNAGEFSSRESIDPDSVSTIGSLDDDEDTDLFEEGRKIVVNQSSCYSFTFRPLSDAENKRFSSYMSLKTKWPAAPSEKDLKLYESYCNSK